MGEPPTARLDIFSQGCPGLGGPRWAPEEAHSAASQPPTWRQDKGPEEAPPGFPAPTRPSEAEAWGRPRPPGSRTSGRGASGTAGSTAGPDPDKGQLCPGPGHPWGPGTPPTHLTAERERAYKPPQALLLQSQGKQRKQRPEGRSGHGEALDRGSCGQDSPGDRPLAPGPLATRWEPWASAARSGTARPAPTQHPQAQTGAGSLATRSQPLPPQRGPIGALPVPTGSCRSDTDPPSWIRSHCCSWEVDRSYSRHTWRRHTHTHTHTSLEAWDPALA